MTVGMKIMRPTSIAKTGASSTASIRATGGVEFDLCESLSLNGVFTSEFDDYMVIIRYLGSVDGAELQTRLRASGTDATGSNYVTQDLRAENTSISATRPAAATVADLGLSSTNRGGITAYFYGPALAQPTACRTVGPSGVNSATIRDKAWTHSLSTAYDGFTMLQAVSTRTASGLVTVYGLAQ